jgi:hypothetical protein
MSISEFFNKKARAVVAASAIAMGGIGGYTGMEIAQHDLQAQQSNFTLAQVSDSNITEKQFIAGRLPGGPVVTPQETAAVAGFNARIDAMAAEQNLYNWDQSKLQSDAVSFVNDLRMSTNITEQDYAKLITSYDKRVGLDVSAITGNYEKGIQYAQEAFVAESISHIFDNDATDEESSKDIGAFMLQAQQMHDQLGLEGGIAGTGVGLLLMSPLLFRRRKRPGFG